MAKGHMLDNLLNENRAREVGMKFATVATGGIGGYLAIKLIQSGQDVATLARGAHLEAIKSGGLALVDVAESQPAHPRITQ